MNNAQLGQEIESLQQQIADAKSHLQALEKRLAEIVEAKAKYELAQEERRFEAELSSWNKDFKNISMFALGPIVAMCVIAGLSVGKPVVIIAGLGFWALIATGFFSGHYVAYKTKNNFLGWLLGVAIINSFFIYLGLKKLFS